MFLLTFEGIDGSGKSTQARLLLDRLEAEGYPVLFVREPGGAELSERIRTLLLDPALDIVPRAEMLLFSAARAQLVDELIRPALDEGRIVVCDRFFDSTTAYQGAGRGVADIQWLQEFHPFVTGDLAPTRTYFIDVPVDVALARRNKASEAAAAESASADRIEQSDEVFYRRVSDGYRQLCNRTPGRIRRVDGTGEVESIHSEIWNDVSVRLEEIAASG